MKRIHVHVIAPPGDRSSPRGDFQTRKIDDRPRRSMFSRNPLRINQRHWPRRRGHRHARMKKFARRLGGIDAEGNSRCRGVIGTSLGSGGLSANDHECGGKK